jgi:hypothetical protein
MSKKSVDNDLITCLASDIPPATPEHLAQLLEAMDGRVDTSEIPETKGTGRPVLRDASGRLIKRQPSPFRQAILNELKRRKMNRYQLWQAAREHCKTIPQSAIYEYLRGQRDIGIVYAEAIMLAVGLVVGRPAAVRRPSRPRLSAAQKSLLDAVSGAATPDSKIREAPAKRPLSSKKPKKSSPGPAR